MKVTIYGKTFKWENFRGFRGFLLYRESFTMNRLASNRKEAATAKVFPLKSFAVCGISCYTKISALNVIHYMVLKVLLFV